MPTFAMLPSPRGNPLISKIPICLITGLLRRHHGLFPQKTLRFITRRVNRRIPAVPRSSWIGRALTSLPSCGQSRETSRPSTRKFLNVELSVFRTTARSIRAASISEAAIILPPSYQCLEPHLRDVHLACSAIAMPEWQSAPDNHHKWSEAPQTFSEMPANTVIRCKYCPDDPWSTRAGLCGRSWQIATQYAC